MMKYANNFLIIPALCGLMIFSGCSDKSGDPSTQPPTTDQNPPQILGGYADPNGVLILNQGASTVHLLISLLKEKWNKMSIRM